MVLSDYCAANQPVHLQKDAEIARRVFLTEFLCAFSNSTERRHLLSLLESIVNIFYIKLDTHDQLSMICEL